MHEIKTKNHTPICSIGFGTMPISAFYFPQPSIEEAVEFVKSVLLQGYNIIDTAMVYGNGQNGNSEKIVGSALTEFNRASIFISTKCGLSFESNEVTLGCSKEHIYVDCKNSLERLGTDYIDLYFLHRVDHDTSLHESLGALVQLKEWGKIRYIGISEVNAEAIEKAVSILKQLGHKLDFIQNEYSLVSNEDETNGVLDLCREHKINYMAYSPLGRGIIANPTTVSERFSSLDISDFRSYLPRYNNLNNLKQNMQLSVKLEGIAKKKKATVSQIALAWLLHQSKKQGVDIFPIPGTKNSQYMVENIKATGITLTQDELNEIDIARSGVVVRGERWPDEFAKYGKRTPVKLKNLLIT